MENENLFRVITTEEEILIQYKNGLDPNIIKLLSINLNKNEIKIENPEKLKNISKIKKSKAKAILGIINIKEVEFLLFVT